MRPRLQLSQSLGIGALLLSAVVISISGFASADGLVKGPEDTDNSKWCHQYAEDAARAATINQKYGCYPQNDPYWTTEKNIHYDHCAYHEDDFQYLAYEREARTIQGENCGYCNSDEFRTASANRVLDNKRFACNLANAHDDNLSDDYWSDDPHIRYNACLHGGDPGGITQASLIGRIRLSMPPEKSKQIESELEAKVDGPQCKGKTDPEIISLCENYATQAYELATYYPQNILNGCSAGQPSSRWSKDWSFHFNWCINPNSAAFRNEEQNVRMTTIRQCAAKNGFAQPSPTDPAFGPASPFGGGFDRSKSLLVGASSNTPLVANRFMATPGAGGFETSKSPPPATVAHGIPAAPSGSGTPAGRPAGMPTGTYRTPTVLVGPNDGGFDNSKNVPPIGQSGSASVGPYHIPLIPFRPNGGIDASRIVPQSTSTGTYRVPEVPIRLNVPQSTSSGAYRIPEVPTRPSGGIDTSRNPGQSANAPLVTHPTVVPAGPTADRRVDPRGTPTKSPIVSANTNLPMKPGNDVAGSFMRQGGPNANRVR